MRKQTWEEVDFGEETKAEIQIKQSGENDQELRFWNWDIRKGFVVKEMGNLENWTNEKGQNETGSWLDA